MSGDEPERLVIRITSVLELWGDENGYDIEVEFSDFRPEKGTELDIHSATEQICGTIKYIEQPIEKFQIWLDGEITNHQANDFEDWMASYLEGSSYDFGRVD